jgi:hypothetical protein
VAPCAAVGHEHDEVAPPTTLIGHHVDLGDGERQDLLAADRLRHLHLRRGVLVDEPVLDAEPLDHPHGAEDVVPTRLARHAHQDALERLHGRAL